MAVLEAAVVFVASLGVVAASIGAAVACLAVLLPEPQPEPLGSIHDELEWDPAADGFAVVDGV